MKVRALDRLVPNSHSFFARVIREEDIKGHIEKVS